MEEEEAIAFEEDEFHGFIRTQVVCLMLFLALYGISFLLIQYFKTRSDSDELYAGDEDFFVYRVSVWMCSCSLAVLHSFPDNYYLKWLNWSLISTLWNYVFLFSNISLFFLLPFAYFFIESQGFSFHRRPKPFLARVYETMCVCALVIVILVTLAHVFYSLFLSEKLSAIFSVFDFSNLSIPLIYSLVSLVGVFLLLLSVPFGFAKMFDVTSKLLLGNEAEEPKSPALSSTPTNGHLHKHATPSTGPAGDASKVDRFLAANVKPLVARASWVRRGFHMVRYPLVILLLLILTGIVIFMVFINVITLVAGLRVLPVYVQYVEVRSRHTFGIAGALVENLIIAYIILSAFVGVYSLPLLQRMRPKKDATSLTCVIANCATILLLSSALPVLARTLGITSFDLLGAYGRLKWISNFSLICSYNVLFAAAATVSLLNKFTSPIRVELRKRWGLPTYSDGTPDNKSTFTANNDNNY
ncbi:hypothetical protein M3Y99_00197900 [Aphelenchoides fujianensis]|nr:hypothetical protein M3Y99_00197900 [Aphelenchoides fujianensis]